MSISSRQLATKEYFAQGDYPIAESDGVRQYCAYGTEVLGAFFQNRLDAYVSGNLPIYYQNNPPKMVSPDVFVVFGVQKNCRQVYKLWQEKKAPDFVLEITSKNTQREDWQIKPKIYAQLGVKEYFLYDPASDYLQPQLQGWQKKHNGYKAIAPIVAGDNFLSLSSEVLDLNLNLQSGKLRFFDPVVGENLLTYKESEQARRAAIAQIARLEVAKIEP